MVPKRVLNPDEQRFIVENYPRLTVIQLATQLRCGGQVVSRTLADLGIATRQSGWQPKLADEKRDAMLTRWRAGESATAIARALDASHSTVRSVVESAGLTFENRLRRGPESPSWKGGRVRNGKYVGVYVDHDDPMRVMADKNGYVMEQRLVVARSLGRPLTSEETVHHKNADPLDNRPGNLQLRRGRHGKHAAFRCRACGSVDVEAVEIESCGVGTASPTDSY